MKTAPVSLCAAAVAMLVATSAARADLVHWSYQWSRTPNEILADAPGTGRITLTSENLQNVVGDSDIVATNLHVSSTASADHPDTFTNKPYTLSLYLLDDASNQGGTLDFTGVFNGTATAYSANIANTFTGPTHQVVVLGDHRYTVTLNYFTPPGPPGASNFGSISAHATIAVDLIESAPEPNALVLAGFGIALVGLARTRNRRRLPLLPA